MCKLSSYWQGKGRDSPQHVCKPLKLGSGGDLADVAGQRAIRADRDEAFGLAAFTLKSFSQGCAEV